MTDKQRNRLVDRKLGTAIILNILNLVDLVVTWIASQTPHIDFTTAEGNLHFVNAYSELLAGNYIPMIFIVMIKILGACLITIAWFHFERNFFLAIVFGVIFSCYSTVSIVWILLIVWAQLPNQLTVNLSLLCLFGVSFVIYYSPSELKEFFWHRILNKSKV